MINLFTKTKNSAALIIVLAAAAVLIGGCASQKSVTQDKAEGAPPSGPKLITEIIATEDSESYLVLVKGNRQLTYTSVKQNLPLGVLFYFPDTGIEESIEASVMPDNDIIESVEASRVSEKQDMSRLLIALKKDIPYDVMPEGTGIKISFTKPQAISAADEAGEGTGKAPLIEAAAPAPVTASDAAELSGIYIIKSENQTRVTINADGAINDFKTFTLDKPARIVFDIPNIKSPFKGQQVLNVNTKWVTRVRHNGYPDKVRIVLDTKKSYLKTFSAHPINDGLIIQIGNEKPAAAAVALPSARPAEPPPAEKPVEPPAADQAEYIADTAVETETGKPAWINRVDFRSEEAGKSAIIIGTTRPVQYDLKETSAKLLQLKLYNTRIPKYRNRPLITTRFESAVNRITPIYKPSMKDTSIVAIELREMVPYVVERQDDMLLVRFEPSTIPPKPLEQADLPPWKTVLAQTEAEQAATAPEKAPTAPVSAPGKTAPDSATEVMPPTAASTAAPEVPEKVAPPPPLAPPPASSEGMAMSALSGPRYQSMVGSSVMESPQYTGEKIALDFYQTDIKNVFRILREISGKNFAIDKNVTGSVTMTLEKPVPWDQVLDLVLKMNRLGMTYEGDIIRIATLSSLTAEEKAKQAKIDAAQKAKAAVESLEPLVTEYIPVNYSDARAEVMPHVTPLLTKDRGKISVDQRNNQLIVTDTAVIIAQVKEIVSRIDTVTPQVIMEAKVVEINSSFQMELGVEWNMAWGPIDVKGDSLDFDVSMNYPAAASSGVGFDFAKLTGTPFLLNATLTAVETENKGRIITAPKIVTLDNKKAQIKQGVEYPYLERDSSGNATVKFKQIELKLEVTPTVTPDDRILMKIFITKNDIAALTEDGPAVSTNEAQTELLVNDGDTIVIGGILKKNEQNSVTGWPGLKDVPLLGWLFKTKKEDTTSNELLIFITPRIVQLEQRRIL